MYPIQTDVSANNHGDVGTTRRAARRRSTSRACRGKLAGVAGRASPSATAPLQKRVGAAGGGGVDGVVEGVDGDLLLRPEDRRGRDLERRQRDLGGAVDGGAVGDGRRPRRQPEGAEEAADDAPAGAVAPVREVVAAARSSSNVLMPSNLAVARAGAELAGRPRSFASSVLDSVMAAVPAKPATRPRPM
jgi:hypothetical protein